MKKVLAVWLILAALFGALVGSYVTSALACTPAAPIGWSLYPTSVQAALETRCGS